MNKWGILGQDSIVESLKSAIDHKKIGNGYLFHGPEGSGKKTLATVFSKAINCESGESQEKPCGVCSSCKKFESGNHPNIEWVRPDGSSIKIRQINQIVADVAKKPYDAGYKIVIIDRGEKMTVDAQNAFLKTLEEPPAFTVFIILVENQKALLTTVVSRCQSYRIKPAGVEDIRTFLKGRYPEREEEIKLASVFSDGIIGRSVRMLEQPDYFHKRKHYGEIFLRMLDGKINLGGEYEFYNSRAEAEWFVDFGLSLTRDGLIRAELGAESEGEIKNEDLRAVIDRAAEKLSVQKLLKIAEKLQRTGYYLRQNVNIKGSMDAMLLNILEVTHGEDDRRPV